jgi:hypothetical protein
VPAAGEWKAASGIGWQHSPKIPSCPQGLKLASRRAWRTWFTSWFAAHWTPADLPGLRHVIMLYDEVERGEMQRMGELRLQQKGYGITPEGQQALRWEPPKEELTSTGAPAPKPAGPYGHLRAVPGPNAGA